MGGTISRLFIWDWFENLRAYDVGERLSRRRLARTGDWIDVGGEVAVPLTAVLTITLERDQSANDVSPSRDAQAYKVVLTLIDTKTHYTSFSLPLDAAIALKSSLIG
jgi:hypothetical protein